MQNFLKIETLGEFVGQKHIISKEKPLYKLIKQGFIPSMVLFGPPATGKTTLAKICAKVIGSDFYIFDATSLKIDEVRKVLKEHKGSLITPVIFIDEIHRLSKTQQEVLLIPLEKKEFILIGATTENPLYSLTSGIRSRVMIYQFYHLKRDEIELLLDSAVKNAGLSIESDAKEFLLDIGEIRKIVTLLQLSSKIDKNIDKKRLIELGGVITKEGVSSKDTHYDLISALIKSIRGSDIDASLYYLARLINSGERADYIARRLVILSSEDIGNANPNALTIATNTLTAVSTIGYPEARIILSQAVIYLASSPKSNSCYKAINQAIEYVKSNPFEEVPAHLKSNCKNYLYPHDFGGYIKQNYMQKEVEFYKTKKIGFEKTLDEWIRKIKNKD